MKFMLLALHLASVFHALATEEGSFTCYYDYALRDHMCYRFYAAPIANYYGALRVCRSEGGDLVSIHDAFINTFLRDYSNSTFLIGLSYDEQYGIYAWSDWTPLDYTNYADGFVDYRDYFGYCAKSADLKWMNAECDTDKLPFICHKRAYYYLPTSPYSCPNESNIHTIPDMVLSPGYPLEYILDSSLSNSGCSYQLLTTNGNHIKIRFEEISMNNTVDRLLIYKGWDENPEYEIARADSDFVDGDVTIDYNRAMIRLPLGSGPAKWKITWSTVKNESVTDPANTACQPSSTIYTQGGWILSPGYPEEFDLPAEVSSYGCYYKLYAKEGTLVRMLFEKINFLLDQGFIEVYKGWTCSDENKLDTIYRKDEGTELTVPYNKVLIRVLNATEGVYKIVWTTVEPEPTTTRTPSITTRAPTTIAPNCSHGGSSFNEACFLQVASQITQPAAEGYCKTYGGHLASIHSKAEQDFINQHFFNLGPYWIGLQCVVPSTKTKSIYVDESDLNCNWTDSSPFDYSNWLYSEVDQPYQCTLGNYNGDNTGKWNEYYCTSLMYFLCKYYP